MSFPCYIHTFTESISCHMHNFILQFSSYHSLQLLRYLISYLLLIFNYHTVWLQIFIVKTFIITGKLLIFKPGVRLWFLKITFVHMSVCVCVCLSICLSVCVSTPKALIISVMIWHYIDHVNNLTAFSTFQLLYMTLAVNEMDGHGLSKTTRYECLPAN